MGRSASGEFLAAPGQPGRVATLLRPRAAPGRAGVAVNIDGEGLAAAQADGEPHSTGVGVSLGRR
jgi:hypothetical protein